MLNENIRNTWDSFIKDYEQYFISNEETWTNNLTHFKNYINLNEQRPKEKSKTEKVLCLWMYTQLGNRKTEKYNKLKEVIRNSSAHSNASE